MSLTIYPTEGYDSFVSVADATSFLEKNSMYYAECVAKYPDESSQEVLLRIATRRIIDTIDMSLFPVDSVPLCISEATSLMAIHDCWYGLSVSQNDNQGLVSREKVGDLEVEYDHRNTKTKAKVTSPFPDSVRTCLSNYGATFSYGLARATMELK